MDVELTKLYELAGKISKSDFSQREILDARGKNIPPGVAYEIAKILAGKLKGKQKYFFVSGDGRLDTPRLLQEFTRAMTEDGITIINAGYNNVTPLFETQRAKLGISGVNVTASHQTSEYNGLKLVIEPNINEKNLESRLKGIERHGIIHCQEELREAYISGLVEKNIGNFEENRIRVLFDALQGVSWQFFNEVARQLKIKADGFRTCINGNFPLTSKGPDPHDKENFEILKQTLGKKLDDYDLIAIVDGDGDRCGIAYFEKQVESPILTAVRAAYLAEKNFNLGKKFVAEYALASIIRGYLAEKKMETIAVKRGRPSHINKIQELREKGENVLGGAEIGLHHYNEQGIDDGVETALLFIEVLQNEGRQGLEKRLNEVRVKIKKFSPELRVRHNNPDKVVGHFVQKYNTDANFQVYGDAIFSIRDTEFILHSSKTEKLVSFNAIGKDKETIDRDASSLFLQLDYVDSNLASQLRQEYRKWV